MPQQSAREQLLRFLDERVFQPALAAQPVAYSTVDERKAVEVFDWGAPQWIRGSHLADQGADVASGRRPAYSPTA